MTLYFFIIILIFEFIPSTYFIIRKINSIDPDEKNMKKGWKVFLFGCILYAYGSLQYVIIRVYFTSIIALIASIINIILASTGAILMYYGLRHEFNV